MAAPATPPSAPVPSTSIGLTGQPGTTPTIGPTLPIGTGQLRSDAIIQARQAAERQRRRAAAGAAPGRPVPSGPVVPAVFTPKTLIGS